MRAALRLVRHHLGRDEIALADLDRTETGIAAALVDQALDEISRLGPPGAAIGVDRDGVGVDAAAERVHVRDVVERRSSMVIPPFGDARRVLREIGAHVGEEVDAHGEEPAVSRPSPSRRPRNCRGRGRPQGNARCGRRST